MTTTTGPSPATVEASSHRTPTVSVCIPAYRAAPFISATIESVLSQTLRDLEVVIVDDASPDDTDAAVQRHNDPRIRFERNATRLGVEANWNRVVALARGRYVKVLGHDDILRPDCLVRQVEIMEAHPQVAIVAGRRNIIDERGRVVLRSRGLPGLSGFVPSAEALRRNVRCGGNLFGEPVAVMLRRELIEQCGWFSGARPYMIDVDYWCRMLNLGPLYAQDEIVGSFRVLHTSLSVALAKEQSAQTVSLFRELRRKHPDTVRRRDLAVGTVRSLVLAAGRGVTYRLLRARQIRSKSSPSL
jgi:glycosyltransferase involved in cell wall biosynthesis